MNNYKFSDVSNKYKFTGTINTGEKHSELSCILARYLNLKNKAKIKDGKVKIYPFNIDLKYLEIKYNEIIASLIKRSNITHESMDELFDESITNLNDHLKELKSKLKEYDMVPYYGLPKYMIGRAKFIRECIKNIPGVKINIDDIIAQMEAIDNKYDFNKDELHFDEKDYNGNNFINDYNLIEENYKKVLKIEDSLKDTVINYWKKYLTDPSNHNGSSYKYVMHTFSKGFVDPNKMSKACCALNTNDLIVTPYGNCGLIFDIDSNSVDTMCCEDAGSWVIDKDMFFERECPNSWQYTDVSNKSSVFYEYEKNSKIIMPQMFEREILKNNTSEDGTLKIDSKSISYSEIYLNNNARAVGVFYNDECNNVDEVKAYAQKYNLPLVHITHNRSMIY